MASLNIASLLKHIDELRVVMHNNDIDVLAINETRMDSTIPIELISLSGLACARSVHRLYPVILGFPKTEIDLVVVLAFSYVIQLISSLDLTLTILT